MKKLYYNAGYFFLILFVFMLAGFYKTYFSLFPKFDAHTTLLVHFHAACLAAWVILLIVQPLLVRYKKLPIHRALGKFTYVLVPLIICSMVGMAIKGVGEIPGKATWPAIFQTIFLPVIDASFFTLFYILAIINKKKIQLHSIYMISTGLVFITPTLSRFFYYMLKFSDSLSLTLTIGFINLVIISLILYLKQQKSGYKPLGKVLCIFLVYYAVTLTLAWGWIPGINFPDL